MIDKQLKAMIDKKGLTLEKLSMLSNGKRSIVDA